MGFRQSRGCSDGLAVLRATQRMAQKRAQPLYTGFVDLSAVFDHVRRSWLFTVMKQKLSRDGQACRLIQIIESLYSNTTVYMPGEKPSTAFATSSGARQGGTESPYLFCAYIDLRLWSATCEREMWNGHTMSPIPQPTDLNDAKVPVEAANTSNCSAMRTTS